MHHGYRSRKDSDNQLQKCLDTPTKKRPFLLQIAPGHRSVRYNTDLPPPSHSKLFLQVLSMVFFLIRGRGGITSTRSWRGHLCPYTTNSLIQFLDWVPWLGPGVVVLLHISYKAGGRSDPANHRGVCVSSCLGKLFCSILNQRVLDEVASLNILHKSQIGLLPNNRKADHVFTLRTLIDEYVHSHNEKIYACFVDFRKAFDSVWHVGLLNKLLQINVGGCFYNLIKSLYLNSTYSIKIGHNQTRSFHFARGVRQGCISSPLLFSLYVKRLTFRI